MNDAHFRQLCSLYGLGDLLTLPRPVTGGLLHRLWEIETTSGHFAVKQLNSQIMQKLNIREAYRRSEQFAVEMIGAGIPTVTALNSMAHDTVQVIDDITVIVYQWVNGIALKPASVNAGQAYQIGQILGKIHTVPLETPYAASAFQDDIFDWADLIASGEAQNISWSKSLRSALPLLIEWTTLCNAANSRLHASLVMSHRDLDPKNVLWADPRSPVVIDWEAVGLINPTLEVVTAALNWAGWPQIYPQELILTALFNGYRSVNHVAIDPQTKIDALAGAFNLLGWLEFNMRRSTDATNYSEPERMLGISETLLTFNGLKMLSENFEQWARWVNLGL